MKLLLDKYELLKSEHQHLLELASKLSSEELNKAFAPGKWSVGQILEHINIATFKTVGYLNKQMHKSEQLKKKDFISELRTRIIVIALRTKLKFKAPAGTGNVSEVVSFEPLLHQHQENYVQFDNLIYNLSESILYKLVFKHPTAGRLTMLQTITFMTEHVRHHRRQIEQYLNSMVNT